MKSLKTGDNRRIAAVAMRFGIVFLVLLTGCKKRDTVSPTVGMDSSERTWIRVLLFGNIKECTIVTPSGFVVEGVGNGVIAEFSDTEPMRIGRVDGRINVGYHVLCEEIMLRPDEPYYFVIDGQGFRGNLHLRVHEDGQSLQVINHVPLESYLLGVVGAEMHSYWEPEALKAQAVAARTYCLAIAHRFGQGRRWDLTRTQANQVYGGLAAENARVRRAVLATSGHILIAPSRDGGEMLFPTYYSSSCGGHTEDSSQVFGPDRVTLDGVDCPWCQTTSRRRDFFWGPVTYSMTTVSQRLMARYAALERLERIVDVQVVRTGAMERITQVRLIGKNGQRDTLRGEDFRLALDPTGRRLRSTLVTMTGHSDRLVFDNGRGFGHGVGLCQYGAQGLAREGLGYADILAYYYPGSRLVRIETTTAYEDI